VSTVLHGAGQRPSPGPRAPHVGPGPSPERATPAHGPPPSGPGWGPGRGRVPGRARYGREPYGTGEGPFCAIPSPTDGSGRQHTLADLSPSHGQQGEFQPPMQAKVNTGEATRRRAGTRAPFARLVGLTLGPPRPSGAGEGPSGSLHRPGPYSHPGTWRRLVSRRDLPTTVTFSTAHTTPGICLVPAPVRKEPVVPIPGLSGYRGAQGGAPVCLAPRLTMDCHAASPPLAGNPSLPLVCLNFPTSRSHSSATVGVL